MRWHSTVTATCLPQARPINVNRSEVSVPIENDTSTPIARPVRRGTHEQPLPFFARLDIKIKD